MKSSQFILSMLILPELLVIVASSNLLFTIFIPDCLLSITKLLIILFSSITSWPLVDSYSNLEAVELWTPKEILLPVMLKDVMSELTIVVVVLPVILIFMLFKMASVKSILALLAFILIVS